MLSLVPSPLCCGPQRDDVDEWSVGQELLYDGNLTLNLSGENRRNKKIELYVLLLDDSIMFLQKQE